MKRVGQRTEDDNSKNRHKRHRADRKLRLKEGKNRRVTVGLYLAAIKYVSLL